MACRTTRWRCFSARSCSTTSPSWSTRTSTSWRRFRKPRSRRSGNADADEAITMKRIRNSGAEFVTALLVAVVAAAMAAGGVVAGGTAPSQRAGTARARGTSGFRVEEATIADLHRAIQSGDTTCKAVIESYVARARAYNGACVQLVTRDGASMPPAKGPMRAGTPVAFPTSTAAVSSVLPNFSEYTGLPLDLGRMEPSASDPAVQLQYGMVTGMPNAGQVNALSTINIRGERSVTCKAQCDLAPSLGPLPASCPASCDSFRRQPDALERAAELDAQYGRHPDLKAMPLYCVAMSFKDVFDTKDMRSTGGADVNYANDAPPRDATAVERLRARGA